MANSRQSGSLEGLPQKIWRHVSRGEIDPATISRGITYIKRYLETTGIRGVSIAFDTENANFEGQRGLRHTIYRLIYERKDQIRTFPEFLDFPPNSKLVCKVYPSGMGSYDAYQAGKENEKFIAAIMGPTHQTSSDYPNNGFYSIHDENVITKHPFRDTNPSGMRRGAIGFRLDGTVDLLDEQEKWKVIRSGFTQYEYVSGTAFYFTSEDKGTEAELTETTDRETLSYLIKYIDAANSERFGFFVIQRPIPRFLAFLLIKNHMNRLYARKFMAVELEYNGGGANVKSLDDGYYGKQVGEFGSQYRPDHYFILRK